MFLNVHVGCRSFIGANSVVKQVVIIGDDMVTIADSIIVRDVLDVIKVFLNPDRETRY